MCSLEARVGDFEPYTINIIDPSALPRVKSVFFATMITYSRYFISGFGGKHMRPMYIILPPWS